MTIQEKKEKSLELKDKIRAKQSQIEAFIQEIDTRISSLERNVQLLKGDLASQILKNS
jgi:hypothetical protein